MDCQGLGGPRGGLPKPAMSPRMIVALSGPEGTEAGDVDGAGPGRRTGSRQNSGAYQAEDAEEHQNAARKPRRAAAAAAAFLTASVFEDEDDEDEPAYRGSKRRGRGVAAMAHNYQMTYGNDGWAALLQGGEEGADAKAQAAAEGAARPAKRPRGRPLASSAGAGAAGTSGEASAIAPAPAGHGTGGSKFFPMESQVRLACLRLCVACSSSGGWPSGTWHDGSASQAPALPARSALAHAQTVNELHHAHRCSKIRAMYNSRKRGLLSRDVRS